MGWWGPYSQREPVLHHVEPVETPPVCGPVHGVIAEAGQGFQGAGSKQRSHGPRERGQHPDGAIREPADPGASATRLPARPSPWGDQGTPSRPEADPALAATWECHGSVTRPPARGRGLAHSLSRGVHPALVLPVVRVKGRVVDEKLRLHRHGGAPSDRHRDHGQDPGTRMTKGHQSARSQGHRDCPQSAHGSSSSGRQRGHPQRGLPKGAAKTLLV